MRLTIRTLCLAIATLAVSFSMGFSSPTQTQIYDARSGKWVSYDPSQAREYFQRYGQTPEEFQRRIVPFRTAEKPGTIVIDADRHFLYYILPDFQAIRYGIGVGREGFGWAGIVHVGRKAEWPTWTPPKDMIERDPRLTKYANGMPGGIDNPLGARALYLYEKNRDSLYRIHGTNEPWTIGLNLSSGCIRMNNDDVIDLYNRVTRGAKVIVLMTGASLFKGV